MSLRTTIGLIFLVCAPLALLGWIGNAMLREQAILENRRYVGTIEGQLVEWRDAINDVVTSQHRRLSAKLESLPSDLQDLPTSLKSMERKEPLIRQMLWVSPRNQLLYPEQPASNDPAEVALYGELTKIARQRPPSSKQITLPEEAFAGFKETTTNGSALDSEQSDLQGPPKQWNEWYFDQGLQLVVWNVLPKGNAIGILAERSRWLSEIIAALPDTHSHSIGCTVLEDAAGIDVYRWGSTEVGDGGPLVTLALQEPLNSWRLKYFDADAAGTTNGFYAKSIPLILSLLSIAGLLLAVGIFVLTSTSRQLQLAAQRVNFVSQVSHELRTPLTNIRLYAELAKNDLMDSPGVIEQLVAKRLEVIDSESKRLSRLINGILEFMQSKSKVRPPQFSQVIPDETIQSVLLQFTPSLDRAEIKVHKDLNASALAYLDNEILEQILVNLLSNVEKYAAAGKSLSIHSLWEKNVLTVDIIDAGPGIPKGLFKRIFKPFFRIDDSVTAPSGTGLGLTIARAAARRHGGDLKTIPVQTGATFRLTLKTGAPT